MSVDGVQERTIDVEGLRTRYLTAGDDGLPLVLLHGVGDNALDWRWVTPALARSHRVYAPDLPGAGESARPEDADYSPVFSSASSPRSWTFWGSHAPRWSVTLWAASRHCAWRYPNRTAWRP